MGQELGARAVALQGTGTPAHTKDPTPPFRTTKEKEKKKRCRDFAGLGHSGTEVQTLLKIAGQTARGQKCVGAYLPRFRVLHHNWCHVIVFSAARLSRHENARSSKNWHL